jgi:RNA polymerase sigma factor (sigma-70 family)
VTDLSRLFEAFLGGNDAAFAELYHDINPRLSAYCYKLIGSRAGSAAPRAEDLMQELWERVIAMRSPTFNKKKLEVINPSAFLFRMLKNLAIDEYRKTKNEVELDEDMTNGSDATRLVTYVTFGSEELTEIEAIVLEALEKLSHDDRELLVLNIYSGYSFREIAEMLGKSTDAIWQQASRARTKLRTIVIEDAKRMSIALPKINGNLNAARTIETKL